MKHAPEPPGKEGGKYPALPDDHPLDGRFLDLHVHSVHSSDGHASIRELFEQAERIGLHGFSLTDHNEMAGVYEGLELAGEFPGVLFIPGLEVTTNKGHILALNISDPIPKGLPIPETIEKIHAQGGIAVAGHPYRLWSGIGERSVLENLELFDAIEAFNARNIWGGNRKAAALVTGTRKPETAGSDCHIPLEMGAGYTVFENSVSSPEEVVLAILEKRSRAGTGKFGVVGPGRILMQGSHCVAAWIKRGFRDI